MSSSEAHISATVADTPLSTRGVQFWLVFVSICLALFLSALELAALSTALPTIVGDLHGNDFVWAGTAYALASTALLPMCGGLAEVSLPCTHLEAV